MNGGSEAGVSERITIPIRHLPGHPIKRWYCTDCEGILSQPTCPHCKQVVREGKDMYSRAGAALRDEWFVPDYLRSQPKDTGQ